MNAAKDVNMCPWTREEGRTRILNEGKGDWNLKRTYEIWVVGTQFGVQFIGMRDVDVVP